MRFERSVGYVLMGFISVMAILLVATLYWSAIGADNALASTFNYRLADVEAAIRRGTLLDRQGNPLVETLINPDRSLERRTLAQAYVSVTGYASRRYGRAGAEAAYDEFLRGSQLADASELMIRQDLLHLPREGDDVRLTINAALQRSASAALQEITGGAVILDAMTGEVLAMASSPTVIPSQLDADWETLITREDKPFLNRPLQGRYLPGNMLLTPLMAAWLIDGRSLDDVLDFDPAVPLILDDTDHFCEADPPSGGVTVRDVLLYGCPAGASEMIARLGISSVSEIFALFQMETRTSLRGFPDGDATDLSEVNFSEADFLGHGTLRLSPLDVAVMEAAFVSGGNAPRPYLLDATRLANSSNWISAQRMRESLPVTTAPTATAVYSMLRRSAEILFETGSSAQIAARTALVSDGEQQNGWFVGSVNLSAERRAVVVLLIENASDTQLLTERGQLLLEDVREALSAN
jgi:peptidoglycan glycosyltransferase